MQQFNLDTWLKNKSRKIITRTGKPVRIVCWDSPNKTFPIVGFVDNEPEIFAWDCFGYYREGHIENENDLFFEDKKKEELTEFEKELQTIISEGSYWTSDDGSISTCCHFGNKEIKKISPQILDLARKEFEKELEGYILITPADFYKEINKAFKHGKEDVFRSFHKLEKTKDMIDPTIPVMYTNGVSMKSYVEYNGYKVCINELFESLPKEE